MISPEERWTTLVSLICSVVFFLGHLAISQELPELPAVPDENAPAEVWENFLNKIDEYIIADQQRLAKGKKRSTTRDVKDRFAEAEKRVDSPHKFIPVEIKKKRVHIYLDGNRNDGTGIRLSITREVKFRI